MAILKKIILLLMGLLFFAQALAMAAEIPALEVTTTSAVPGDEGRYIICFSVNEPLVLGQGTAVKVDFPGGYSLVKQELLAADPGCTLTNIRFKRTGDRHDSILYGTALAEKSQLNFMVGGPQVTLPPGTQIFLSVPGVINKPAAGIQLISISVADVNKKCVGGKGWIVLGDPPAIAPQGLRVTAERSDRFSASWEPVPGATRYQLYFATDPNGTYIQACDLGRDPGPGETWNLKTTQCEFSARGNSGIAIGRKYYFKVRAGNDYGFGQLSAEVVAATPIVAPTGKPSITVTSGDAGYCTAELKLEMDRSLEVAAADKVRLFEEQTGNLLPILKLTVKGNSVDLLAEVKPKTGYKVVFYEGALAADENSGVINTTIGWQFNSDGSISRL